MASPRRRRPEPPAPEPERYGTYTVVGPHPVLGKKRGEQVELEERHAGRLMRAGHVEPAPPPDPPPKPKKTKKTEQPRQSAGLSHAQGQTGPEPKDESSAETRPQQQDVKEAGDG